MHHKPSRLSDVTLSIVFSLVLGAIPLLSSCNRAPDSGLTPEEATVVEDFPEGEGICSFEEVQCGESADMCADLSVSIQHCGSCGNRCFSNQKCADGACAGVGVLTAKQLKEALDEKDFVLINVRVPPIGLIPGTDASISHNRIDQLLEKIGPDRNRKVVLYCGTATRIKVALQLLHEKGYNNVSVLEEGVMGWMKAGYDHQSSKQ